MPRILPDIANMVAHLKFQGDMSDTGPNSLAGATLNTFTSAPGGTEQYAALDACTQGFSFDGSTKIILPSSTPLRNIFAGPWTIQFTMFQQPGGLGTSCWLSCADPAGRSGGAAPDRIGSLFTLFWGIFGPGAHVYFTDKTHGSNLGGVNNWTTSNAGWENQIHVVALTQSAPSGGFANVNLYVDGVVQASAIVTVAPETVAGTERFYIGGCEGSNQGPYNIDPSHTSKIADLRILNVERSPANLAADAAYQLVACGTPTVAIVAPPAGAIAISDPLVFTVLGAATHVGATVTDASGLAVVAYDNGFVNGFTGNDDDPIAGGNRFTINPPVLGWPYGPLRLDVSATDTFTTTDTRSWSVAAAGTYADQALSRVIIQYRESPNLLAEIAAHAGMGQQVDDCLQVFSTLDDPAVAGGTNLDVDGEVVGEGRTLSNGDVADDSEYRILIGARITRNNGRVTAPEYLATLVAFFGVTVVLSDHGGMAISYTVLREPTADEIAILNEDIVARPMGVKVVRSWAPTVYFGFNNDPAALGFSDHTGTVGGPLAREF